MKLAPPAASIYRVLSIGGRHRLWHGRLSDAAMAIRSGSSVLTIGPDFELIASVVVIQLDSYS
ncbi:MAG: hypothetical protein E2O99_01635 [Acidobacteria bacterium]|nr:hypothetical protein [Acidobacteriota bacterium]MCZ6505181.1 hypothetical protein [Actinomycetota bacterium]MCZ6738742.1 hypothetical protein [Actinomycetota bacterium]TDI38040.1 MAG: hypothetical protein E2O99_01635 [Acidobacteriota bacterium]